MSTKLNTPWGFADQVSPIGDHGILCASTPGHGGLFVPDELLGRLPQALRGSNSYSGKRNWFEEDVEWAIPVIAFPEEFPAKDCQAAVSTIECYKNHKPGEYLYSAVKWLAGPGGDAVKA